VLAATIVASANDASRAYASVSAHDTVSAKADRALRDALETLSLGIYDGSTQMTTELETALRKARYHEARAKGAGWLLAGLGAAFLGAVCASGRARRRKRPRGALARHLLGVSALFLMVGLLAPILTVTARQEIGFLGEVVLQHESKGILTTIHKLQEVGNHFTALLLALFSVVLPVLKIVLSLGALGFADGGKRRASLAVVKFIGRWSMTDVFVVAVLLAFLTADTAQLTDARLEPGLYFFAGYGLLSIAAGHLMLGEEERARDAG